MRRHVVDGTVTAMRPVQRFAEILRLPEAQIPLDEGALLIAQALRPEVDVDVQLARLDSLAGDVRDGTLTGLTRLLFRDLGFAGNRVDYYDPRNSFLDEVLDRRVGIPITLAVLTMEVGRRAGVPLRGVGMPGHFLVRDMVDHDLFLDVFAGGRPMDARACRLLFRQLHGHNAPFEARFLDPVGRDQILVRMVANLRSVYAQRNDARSLAAVLELHAVSPGSGAAGWRELGSVLGLSGAYARAADAYERAAVLTEADGGDGSDDVAHALALWARCN